MPASGRASSFLPLDKQALLCRGVRSVVRARSLLPPTGSLGGAGTEGFTEVPSDWGAPGPEEVRRTAAPPMTVASLLSSWQFDEDDGGMDVTAFALPVLVSPGLRLYDVSLVYSRFYKTPAFFISGSDGATGEALNPEELLQDDHGDNSRLTATSEPHPQGLFGGRPCISIHPCRHASMMARALAREAQVAPACGSRASAHLAAEDPRLALYLPAFVKLLGSACPSLAGDWIN